jgi:uncharacterized membrane protein
MKWTAKLPALIVGIVLFIAGLFLSHSKWRYAALSGALLLIAGAGFITYSMTIKEWCKVVNEQSAFSAAFSPSLRGCLKQKRWLEL